MRRALLALVLCAALSVESSAQIIVYDPAVTARNTATAAVEEFLLNTERQQHSQLRRMAQRLSLFTSLAKYALEIRHAGARTAETFCSRRRTTTR